MKFKVTKKELLHILHFALDMELVMGDNFPDEIELEGEPVEDKCECVSASREDFHKCFGKPKKIEEKLYKCENHHCFHHAPCKYPTMNPLRESVIKRLNKSELGDLARKIEEIIKHINEE